MYDEHTIAVLQERLDRLMERPQVREALLLVDNLQARKADLASSQDLLDY